MTAALFLTLCTLTGLVCVFGLVGRAAFLEYPFLAAVTYAGWVIPQIFALLTTEGWVAEGLPILITMAVLCLVAIVWGWSVGRQGGTRTDVIPLSLKRLFWPVVALTAFTALMQLLVLLQPVEARASSQWSGPLTIIGFFRSVGVVAFSFSIIMFLHRKTFRSILLLAANLALYTPALLIAFRRAEILEVALALPAGLWLARRIAAPKWAVIAAGILAVPLIFAIGELRALGGAHSINSQGQIVTKIPTLEEVLKIDFLAATPFVNSNAAVEVRNAANYMATTSYFATYAFGMGFWNRLVHAYIPGQLLGVDFKNSLFIGKNQSQVALEELSYKTQAGTTGTGFADAFHEFWFFGAAIFFVTAWCLGRIYSRAYNGDIHAQVLYMSTIVAGLQDITHSSFNYFVNTPILFLAAFLVVRTARQRRAGRPMSLYDMRMKTRLHP